MNSDLLRIEVTFLHLCMLLHEEVCSILVGDLHQCLDGPWLIWDVHVLPGLVVDVLHLLADHDLGLVSALLVGEGGDDGSTSGMIILFL